MLLFLLHSLSFALQPGVVGTPTAAQRAVEEALALHAGQDRMSELVVEAARAEACALNANLWNTKAFCEGWPDLVTLQAACTEGHVLGCVGVAWELALVDGRFDAEARDPARAAQLFAEACDAHFGTACLAHAQMEHRGIGLEAAPEAAVAVYRRRCDDGQARACVLLGKALQVGAGVPADPEQARRRFQQACDADLPAGCGALALVQHLGVGGDKQVAEALTGYRTACERGFLPACDNLNMIFEAGLTELDPGPRRTALARGCEEGRPAACGHYGDAMLELDPAKALAAYQIACDAGLARGCRGVGLAARAEGDLDRAVELLRGACEVGEPIACRVWGAMLASGEGVERDLEAAFAARRVGCTNGDGEACFEAGRQLHKGKGAAKDRDAAASMRERACGLGYEDACR